MSPEEIRTLANELASPSNQLLNWLVIGLICLASGFGHYFVAWLKKSGEIEATNSLLGKVVKKTKAIAKAQENIRQDMADSIWRDQRRWELEFELYERILISLCDSRSLYGKLQLQEIHQEGEASDLYDRDLDLANDRRALLQRASLLMPAKIFNEFQTKISIEHIDSTRRASRCRKFVSTFGKLKLSLPTPRILCAHMRESDSEWSDYFTRHGCDRFAHGATPLQFGFPVFPLKSQ